MESSRSGLSGVDPEKVIVFPRGFVGFPTWNRFVLLACGEDGPLGILQSVDDPELALAVVDPRAVVPDYVARVSAAQLQDIGIATAEQAAQAVVLAVVSIPDGDVRKASANLLAPLIINPQTRRGVQVILEGSGYAIRHPLAGHARPVAAAGSRLALVAAAGA